MYKIIGADKKEYGPVDLDVLRQWVVQGRANGETLVQPESGGDWQPMSAYPEFADVLGAASAVPGASTAAAPAGVTPEALNADYDLDIGGCVSQSWQAFTRNFGLMLGGSAVFLLIQLGMSAVGQIPILGLLMLPVTLIVSGPLMGGFYYYVLKNLRGQPIEVGEVFCGFKKSFGQLIGGYLVLTLIVVLAAVPGIIMAVIPGMAMAKAHEVTMAQGTLAVFGALLAIIPMVYLSVCWIFTMPLIVDKGMDFWSAMGASRKKVSQHWWTVFALSVVAGLIYAGGLLACCVGIFCTLPIAVGAWMAAYERMFNARVAATPSGTPSA